MKTIEVSIQEYDNFSQALADSKNILQNVFPNFSFNLISHYIGYVEVDGKIRLTKNTLIDEIQENVFFSTEEISI